MILHIQDKDTTLHFIPRDVSHAIRKKILESRKESITYYGYKLDGELVRNFLKNECSVFEYPKDYIE